MTSTGPPGGPADSTDSPSGRSSVPDATQVPGMVADLTGQVVELKRVVARLVDQVVEQAPADGDPQPLESAAPSGWVWASLDKPGQQDLLDRLTPWVAWLNHRYDLTDRHRIPGCWAQHGGAVEELTALMAAWEAAYHGPADPRSDMAYWHRNYLWPTLHTLNADLHLNQCERGRGEGHTGRVTGPFDPMPAPADRPRYEAPVHTV